MKIGKVSDNAYKRSILRQLKTKRKEVLIGAGLGEDCAIFSVHSNDCPSQNDNKNDDYVIVSCALEGTEDVTFLVTDCLNRLAVRGAEPIAITLNVLLPADAMEETLKEIVAKAEAVCGKSEIQIAQACGRVMKAVNCPVVTVVSYGGAAKHRDYYTVKTAKPGWDIVVSKWIGMKGTAVLARAYRNDILERYPKWICDKAEEFESMLSVIPEAATAIKSGVCSMQTVSEGGIFASLWELAEGAGVGLTIDLKKLPIRQETVEICNHLNVNPYELCSGGCLLMTASNGQNLVERLKEAGIPAVVVGQITDSNDRLIVNDGEERYLDRPHADSLYEKLD